MYLFHGSDYDTLRNEICKKGFDRSFNVRSKHGVGDYFAKTASYCIKKKYSTIHNNGYIYLLFCRVICGTEIYQKYLETCFYVQRIWLWMSFCKICQGTWYKTTLDDGSQTMVNDLSKPSIFVTTKVPCFSGVVCARFFHPESEHTIIVFAVTRAVK